MNDVIAIQKALKIGGFKAKYSDSAWHPWLSHHEANQEPAAYVFHIKELNHTQETYHWIKETMRKEGYQLFLMPKSDNAENGAANVAFVKTYLLDQMEMDAELLVRALVESRPYLRQDRATVQCAQTLNQQITKWRAFRIETSQPDTCRDAECFIEGVSKLQQTLATFREDTDVMSDAEPMIEALWDLLWHLGATQPI